MKKVTLFIGMIAVAAFLSTSVVAQDKATKDTKASPSTTTTTAKTDAKASSKDTKEGCKPGCTGHKDGGKCCDKDKKTTTPEKK